MIIYKTTNLMTGDFYIGKDSKNNPKYLGSGLILKRAIKKYGVISFTKDILEYCTIDNINEREIYWIDLFRNKYPYLIYNIGKGGIGGDNWTNHPEKNRLIQEKYLYVNRGINHPFYGKSSPKKNKANTPEVRAKISTSLKTSAEFQIAVRSIERSAKISAANKGKVLSVETRLKLTGSGNGMFGKQHTPESKTKMGFPRGLNPRARTVVAYNGIETLSFDCITSAAHHFDIPRTTMGQYIKNEIVKNEWKFSYGK